MEKRNGYFVVSLDLELYWGMFDKVTLAEYGDRIRGERTAIPRMLDLFRTYEIHATWATVGMLMARDKHELYALLPPPPQRPMYEDMRVSAYRHIETAHIGESEVDDPYHFGPSLVELIRATPHQEIGNHTFSHYYCIDGHRNDIDIFVTDLERWNAVARTYAITATSMVFPRNQPSIEALAAARKADITAYRGNERHYLYEPRRDAAQSLLIRAFRLLDHYVNLTGYHTYPLPIIAGDAPLDVPSSRFLRPWNSVLRFLEPIRLRRIKRAMAYAAEHGEVFHLWWHPHNFGVDQEENFRNLTTLLEHYRMLSKRYGMKSASMADIAKYADG